MSQSVGPLGDLERSGLYFSRTSASQAHEGGLSVVSVPLPGRLLYRYEQAGMVNYM